jgi:hypothetical protein
MGERIEGDPPEGVGGIVALAKRDGGVSILVRHHREHEHWKRKYEVAQLRFQVVDPMVSGSMKVKQPPDSSQSAVPLDLAWSARYLSRRIKAV